MFLSLLNGLARIGAGIFVCTLPVFAAAGDSATIGTDPVHATTSNTHNEDSKGIGHSAAGRLSHDTTTVAALDKLVVSANRRQRLLDASRSLSVIRPDDWAGTSKSIADAVAEQTGVQTRRYGGTGSFQTVSIRGVQGSKVQVLLDGIPLNSAMGGAVDLGSISPDRLSEIEVYKGITPAQFGGNSLGGVINLISKSSLTNRSLWAHTAIGAYGYQKYSIESDNPVSDRLRIFCSLNYAQSDNDWPYLDRNKTYLTTADDTARTVENHHYNFFEARLQPSFDLPAGRKLACAITYSTSEVGIPAEEGYTNKTARHYQNMFMATSRLSPDITSDTAWYSITPEIGYARLSDNTFWTSLDENMGPSHGAITLAPNSYAKSKSDLHIMHATFIADFFPAKNHGGQIVLAGKHSQILTTTHAANFPHGDWPGNSQEMSLAADVNSSLPAGPFRFGATMGAGVKTIRSATEGGYNDFLKLTVEQSDTAEYPWSAHGGFQCQWNGHIIAFVNAARCSAVPTLRERYGVNGAVAPNPYLTEETSVNTEVGFRFLYNRFTAEATAFRTRAHNGVFMIFDGHMRKPVNLASSVTTGMEASIWWQPIEFMKFDIRATYQDAENRTHLYKYYGKKLPNEPDLSTISKLTLQPFTGIELQYWLDYKSLFFRDFANTDGFRVPGDSESDGIFFNNALISCKTIPHLEVTFSIRNFNRHSFHYDEITHSAESGYSWILYPANEWCITAGYSF